MLALENQLKAEGGNQNWWLPTDDGLKAPSPTPNRFRQDEIPTASELRPKNHLLNAQTVQHLVEIPTSEPILLEFLLPQDILPGPLWGQYYRFLPVKPALRVLAHLSKERLPTVPEFRATAVEVAERVGRSLRARDAELGLKLGDLLATSFPESTDKSRKRYADQFLIYTRPSDRRHDGLLPRLKMVSVRSEGGSVRIGLTEAGFNFARLENPLMDSRTSGSPLGSGEKEFLVTHIAKELPEEADHMHALLALLAKGIIDRVSLNKKMRDYYYSLEDKKRHWTDAHVNTMRAGLMSRLHELGLTSRTKQGLTVSYVLTDQGRRFLQVVGRARGQ